MKFLKVLGKLLYSIVYTCYFSVVIFTLIMFNLLLWNLILDASDAGKIVVAFILFCFDLIVVRIAVLEVFNKYIKK